MCRTALHNFLRDLPKCEHHVHLEGCLTPELVFDLAKRNGVQLPDPAQQPEFQSPATLHQHYEQFQSLDHFLSYYFLSMSVLQHRADFEDLAWSYFCQAYEDGVRHAEVFFDPQEHMHRGVAYETVLDGFGQGCRRAERELGMSTKLILCYVRHLPLDDAMQLFVLGLKRGDFETTPDGPAKIAGIGCSSSEIGPPKDLFREIYVMARDKGIARTAHAGEEGDPSYISAALDAYHVQRIDHGTSLADDAMLMERVAREEILLTVCPATNIKLRYMDRIDQLPIREFMNAGIRFSINSDDPAYFGGFILHNYCAVQEAFDLSVKEWIEIAKNSVQGSWVGDERKAELLRMVDEHGLRFSEA